MTKTADLGDILAGIAGDFGLSIEAVYRAVEQGWSGGRPAAEVVAFFSRYPEVLSALESLVLPARVRDYESAYLDELTASGEVLWAGHGTLPGSDGWVSLHLADQAALTLPEHAPFEHSELHQQVLDALTPGGAWFFRQLGRFAPWNALLYPLHVALFATVFVAAMARRATGLQVTWRGRRVGVRARHLAAAKGGAGASDGHAS